MESSRFSAELLRDIRARVSLLEVVRQTVPLKRKGRDWWGPCPFHNEKTASFHVREAEGYYHCFSCGAHGDVIRFVQETRGGSFPETVEHLAGLAGIRLERQAVDPVVEKRRTDGLAALERAAVWFSRNLVGAPLEYLRDRGLTDDTIRHFRLGFSPDSWNDLRDALLNEGFSAEIIRETGLTIASEKGKGDYDRFRGRVMFPIQNLEGRPVAFGGRVMDKSEPKYLNSPETPFFNKGQTLFALNHAREAIRREKQALIVEGYMDVVGLWQGGVRTAVAPLGTALTETQVELLWRYHDAPIVCLDGDKAGRGAARRAARRVLSVLVPGKTLRFAWMPDGEDPDSLVRKQGPEAFHKVLQTTEGLEDVLWAELTATHPPATGEGRAALEAEIFELGRTLTHDGMRRHLIGALKDRLWQARSSGRDRSFTPRLEEARPQSADMGRLLLALVVHTPALLPRVEEEFARLSFVDVTHQALQRTLLRALAEKRLEKVELSDYLHTTGTKTAADELVVRMSVGKVVETEHLDDLDLLERYWRDMWDDVQRHQRQQRREDAVLETYGDAVVSDPDAWARLVKAKRGQADS